MNIEAFVTLITSVPSVLDDRRVKYEKFEREGDYITFLKANGGFFKLYLKDLYNAYVKSEVINKIIMSSFVPKEFASMAFELLKATGIYDARGYRRTV